MKKLLLSLLIAAALFALAGYLEYKWDLTEKVS